MAYVADLITVLNLLFGEVTAKAPNNGYQTQAPKVTSEALVAVHQTHKMSEHRREIYRRIRIDFPTTAQNLSFMPEGFRSLLFHSLGFDPVPLPDSGNTERVASSSPVHGVGSSSRPTEVATSPVPRVAPGPPPPTNAVMPPKSDEEAAPEPNPNVWSRFVGCLTHPIEMATSSSVTRVAPPSPQSVGVFNINLKSRKAPRTASPQSTSPPFWRDHRPWLFRVLFREQGFKPIFWQPCKLWGKMAVVAWIMLFCRSGCCRFSSLSCCAVCVYVCVWDQWCGKIPRFRCCWIMWAWACCGGSGSRAKFGCKPSSWAGSEPAKPPFLFVPCPVTDRSDLWLL